MKGSTSRWTTAIAAAALLGVPAAAFAQPPAQTPTSQTTTTSSQPPTSTTQPPASTSGTQSTTPATQSTEPATPQNPAQPPAAQTSAQPQATQVDAAAAKQALSDARDTLAQLASMPEAAKLQGEQRTQVSQLISNFNELITTQSNWRASYDKVAANLTALIGPDTGSAETTAAAPAPTPAPTATPGAVGTAGATELDPAIRAKLVELRRNLVEFQKASGGTDK